VGLNIKNARVEGLAEQVARLAGENKTEAIGRALEDRLRSLSFRVVRKDRERRLREFLAAEIWPAVPADERGRRLTKRERERILGIGPEGA
jgi:antitoxin VapB